MLSNYIHKKIVFVSSLFIAVAFSLMLLNACSRRSPSEEIHFRVNEDLLGKTHSDSLLAVSIGIPAGWSDITEEIRQVVDQIFADSEELHEQGLVFRKGFGKLEEIVFMLLFEFEYEEIDDDRERAISIFLADYAETAEVFHRGSYRHNDIHFNQLTTQDNDMINIKLLAYGDGESIFALDFFIPEVRYMDYIETIESSIGSIKEYYRR